MRNLPVIALRPVADADLDALFDQMRDPESVWMAAFTPADPDDRTAFDAHMARVRSSPDVTLRGHVRRPARGQRCYLHPRWRDRRHLLDRPVSLGTRNREPSPAADHGPRPHRAAARPRSQRQPRLSQGAPEIRFQDHRNRDLLRTRPEKSEIEETILRKDYRHRCPASPARPTSPSCNSRQTP